MGVLVVALVSRSELLLLVLLLLVVVIVFGSLVLLFSLQRRWRRGGLQYRAPPSS